MVITGRTSTLSWYLTLQLCTSSSPFRSTKQISSIN